MGSFFVFLASGAYSITIHKLNSTDIPWINYFGYIVILLVGCYYFYFEACTEIDEELKIKLSKASRFEWIIRIINQVILLSLWFILEKNFMLFCCTFFLLISTFLIWDLITIKHHKDIRMLYLDIFALIASIIFVYANIPINDGIKNNNIEILRAMQVKNFLLAFSTLTFIVIIFTGIFITKYEPFKSKYWKRPLLH